MSDTETITPTAPLRIEEDAPLVIVEERPDRREVAVPDLPRSTRGTFSHVVQRGLTLFVALCVGLLVFLYFGTSFMHSRSQRALRDQFRSNSQNQALPGSSGSPYVSTDTTGAQVEKPIPSGTAIAILHIPRIGVNEAVVEGTSSSDTLKGPGHLAASPLPGQLGNAVVLARHDTGGAPFHDIGSLKPGDHFSFDTAIGTVTYTVISVSTHPAADMSIFATQHLGAHNLDTATLVTTTGLLDSSHRRVVLGQLEGTPAGFTPGHVAPSTSDLGLAMNHDGLLALVLAMQLLLLASIGAVWLARRWHRHAAWTVATPLVLCCAWLVFEQFVRVLPSAL